MTNYARPNQQVRYTVEAFGAGGVELAIAVNSGTFQVGSGSVVSATIVGNEIVAEVPAGQALGDTTFSWAWSQTVSGITSTRSDTYPVTIIASNNTDILLNTTSNVPSPSGTYSVDGPAVNAYCSVKDVFIAGMGVQWELIQQQLDKYRILIGSGSMTVPDYIANELIPMVESEVDVLCGMTHKPTEISMMFDGNNTSSYMLPYYPVFQLNFVSIYSIPSSKIVKLQNARFSQTLGPFDNDAYYASSEIIVNPETGQIYIPPRAVEVSGFPLWTWNFVPGTFNVEVSWRYGFKNTEAVPKSFTSAVATLVAVRCLEYAGIIEQRGLAQRRVGDSTYTTGREHNKPYSDQIDTMTARAKRLLVPFKKV